MEHTSIKERREALTWWNHLIDSTKHSLFCQYWANNFTPAQSHDDLTGREIEKIHKSFLNQTNGK